MKVYRVVTAHGATEYLNADRADISDSGRLSLYVGDDIVGSFVGFSSFNVVESVAVPETNQPYPEA